MVGGMNKFCNYKYDSEKGSIERILYAYSHSIIIFEVDKYEALKRIRVVNPSCLTGNRLHFSVRQEILGSPSTPVNRKHKFHAPCSTQLKANRVECCAGNVIFR